MDIKTEREWHTLETEDVIESLDTTEDGLSDEEARERLEHFGPHEIDEADEDTWYQVLLRQFRSPMIIFLMVAAVITLVLGEWFDSLVIALTLVLNASLGFWQERKAARDMEALKSLTVTEAVVVRSGNPEKIPARELVVGDTVQLKSGDKVPADLRLIHVSTFQVDESMLTGESLTVDKTTDAHPEDTGLGDRFGMAYSGTLVASGRATGVVVATGKDTELGTIAESVQTEGQKTPLQHLTDTLEKYIAAITITVAVIIGVVAVIMGTSWSDAFRSAVALIVSALPEALPIVLTVALGVGVSRMSRHNALIRHLPSVETLGSTDTIGSDKTGTLTVNQMTVERVWTPDGDLLDLEDNGEPSEAHRQALLTGALSNEATRRTRDEEQTEELVGNAVDVAIAQAAIELQVLTAEKQQASPIASTPYESKNKYSQVVFEDDGRWILHVKGAPETLLEFCSTIATESGEEELDKDVIHSANDSMADEGLRVIATAQKEISKPEEGDNLPDPSDLTLTGLLGMMDPPREGVREAVEQCQDAGIRVMMITGDHPVTAEAIGKQLGLESEVGPLTGADMADMDDEALLDRLHETTIAARMSPSDKLRIVKILQDDDDIVAITGDGVNDAPALKAASVGVVMGQEGTDVARESADLVLADDNFVTIVEAVKQGRVTFSAIRKATRFLLANGLATMLAVALSVFMDQPLIFLPAMLIFMNVITNGIQDIAIAFEPAEGDELSQPPRPKSEGVLDATMLIRTLITGLWMGIGTVIVYSLALAQGYEQDHARTLALITMVMFNFFNVFNARSERTSLFRINPLRNPLLLGSALIAIALQWGAMTWPVSARLIGLAPLSAAEWLLCTAIGVTVLLLVEADKLIRRLAYKRAE